MFNVIFTFYCCFTFNKYKNKTKTRSKRKKEVSVDDGGVDLISRLPDELLVSILCRLSMEETVRTSVLSSRWCKLWTIVPVLNFDSLHRVAKMMPLPYDAFPSLIQTFSAYFSWVNSVLASHSPDAKVIDEIRFHFNFHDIYASGIKQLISFAIQNNVHTLELYLPLFQNPLNNDEPFSLERHHFLSSVPLHFRVLRFKRLDMSDDVLNYILSNSPCLEQLYICSASKLMNVKITGPSSSNLKYIEMHDSGVAEVVISQTSLECLIFSNMYQTELVLNNLPRLVDVQLASGSLVCYTVNEIPIVFSCCVEQIQKLLVLITIEKHGVSPELAKWPTFSNLRHLELGFRIKRGTNFCPLMSFLEACPMLQILKLKYGRSYDLRESVRSIPERKAPQVTQKNNSFRSLKVLELRGYIGDTEDAEFIAFVLENAKSLKKLIVTLANLKYTSIEPEYLEREKRLTEESAIQLKSKIPSDAEFHLASRPYP